MASPDGIKSFLKKAAEIKGIEYTEDDANALIRSYDYDYGKLVNALGKSTGITDDGIEDFRKSAYEKFKIVDLDENHRQELKLQDSPLEIDDPDGYKKYDYLKTQYNYTNYLMGELDKKKPQAVKQDETKAFQAQFAVEGVQPQMPESFTTNELPLDTYAQRRQTLEQRKKALGDLVDKQAKDNKDKLGYISKEALYYRDQEKSIDQQIKNLEEKISKSGTPQIVGDQMIRIPDNRLKAELRTLKNIKTQIKNIYIALEAPAGSSVKSQLSGLYNGLFNSAPMEDFVTLGFNEAARNLDIIRTAKDYQRELSFLYTTTQNSGLRADGTPKGIGWLGEIKLPNGGVATEYSIGVEMDGQDFEIPTLVPTLSEEEVSLMVNDIIPNNKPIPESIVQKSIDHANQRISQGLSPFISNEEAAFNALKPEDAALLKTYQLMTAIKSENPGNFFYKAGEGVQDMLPFIVEFAATGGIGAGAKKIATKGVDAMMKAMVKKYATREATTLAAKTAGIMAKAAAQSLVMPSTIKGTIEKQLPNINEQGNLEAGLDPTKAFFNTWVEMMAEVIGEDVADIAKVAYRNSIIKDLAKNPGKAREIYLKTMNFISSDAGIPSVQGMPFELLGEQITGALQAVQNDDYSFYTPEQQLHLLAVVAIAGGSSSILSVPQRIQTRMSFQDASKKLEDNPDQRFTDAVKNIVINYNDVNEGMKAYLDMQKNFRGSLTVEQYKTGLDYLYKAYRYNQISVTRSAEIQRGIAEFGDNSGNLSTAIVDGETLYIRNPELAYNPQNPETYNNILYTRTADGTVKPMQAGKVGVITTQSFDDVSAVTEQEMKIKEERYLKAEQAKKDAASKNITPGREVKTPDGKASVSNINETGITVTNAKGESFVYSLDQVEPILSEKEKEQQKAEHEALHKGIAPEATVLQDQSEDITNNRVLRVVDFSNGQSKIFVDGKETIVNSEKDKEQILQEIYSQEIQSLSLELQNKINDINQAREAELAALPTDRPIQRTMLEKEINRKYDQLIDAIEYDAGIPKQKSMDEMTADERFEVLRDTDPVLAKEMILDDIKELQEKAKELREMPNVSKDAKVENLRQARAYEKEAIRLQSVLAENEDYLITSQAQALYGDYIAEQESAQARQLEPWEEDFLSAKVNQESFERQSDKSHITRSFAQAWFTSGNNAGKRSGNLDMIAQELSELHGLEITEEMLVDFMLRYRNKSVRQTTDKQNEIRREYKALTGESIDNHFAYMESKGFTPAQTESSETDTDEVPFKAASKQTQSAAQAEDVKPVTPGRQKISEVLKDGDKEVTYHQITERASQDLRERMNALKALIDIAPELAIHVNIVNSSEIPTAVQIEEYDRFIEQEYKQLKSKFRQAFAAMSQQEVDATISEFLPELAGKKLNSIEKGLVAKSFMLELQRKGEVQNLESMLKSGGLTTEEWSYVSNMIGNPAFIYGETVYVISDRITSVSEMKKNIIHEVAAHLGFRRLFVKKDGTDISGIHYKSFDVFWTAFNSMSENEKQSVAKEVLGENYSQYFADGNINQQGKDAFRELFAQSANVGGKNYRNFTELMLDIYDSMPKKDRLRLAQLYYPQYWSNYFDAQGNQIAEISDYMKSYLADEYLAERSESEEQLNWLQKLAHVIRKAFGFTSKQFSNTDIINILNDHRELIRNGLIVPETGAKIDPEDPRFKILGEKGAARLDEAEEATKRMDYLRIAKEMEEGIDSSYFFNKIPAELQNDARIINRGEDIDGKSLARIQADPEAKAAWADYLKALESIEERKSLSPKELKKRIRLATGWEKGADGKWRYERPDIKTLPVPERIKAVSKIMQNIPVDLVEYIDDKELFAAYPGLRWVKLAFDKSMQAHGGFNIRKGDGFGQITINPDKHKNGDDILKTIAHEIQHAIQRIEGFAGGGSPNDMALHSRLTLAGVTSADELPSRINELKTLFKQIYAEWERKAFGKRYKGQKAETEKLLRQWMDIESLIEKLQSNTYDLSEAFDLYKRLAGEVEARNVESRMGMSEPDRYKTLLEDTEDVARKDQIILRNGLLSQAPNSIRFKAQEVFYSPTEKAVNDLKQEKGTVSQMKKMILDSGAKEAELDWMGFSEAFPNVNGKVTKQELQDWVQQNKIVIDEVEKKTSIWIKTKDNQWEATIDNQRVSSGRNPKKGKITIIYDGDNYIATDNITNFTQSFKTLLDAIQHFEERKLNTDTRYSEYQIPGGENYKELLLMLPSENVVETKIELKWEKQTDNLISANLPNGNIVTIFSDNNGEESELQILTPDAVDIGDPQTFATIDEAKQAANNMIVKKIQNIQGGFISGHWDEPNIVAHIRMNERVVNDENVLFIEEIQSDWAQKGRNKGFKSISDADYAKLDNRRKEIERLGLELKREGKDTPQELKEEWVDIMNKIQPEKRATLVPDMPFKQTDQWVNLAARRITRYAAENGFDRIAWTNGEMQVDRFDLSNHVDQIVYKKTDDKYDVGAKKQNKVVFHKSDLSESDLPNIVGKDVAQKIINGESSEGFYGIGYKGLSGLDLKVGGEGMKAFYDSIVPKSFSKIGKKFGATIETINIKQSEKYDIEKNTSENKEFWTIFNTQTEEAYGNYDNKQKAVEVLEKLNNAQPSSKTLSIPVTESMVKSVLAEGVPMFKVAKSKQEIIDFTKDSVIKQDLYHGTNSVFTDFDKSKIGSATDRGFYGKGFYFTFNSNPAWQNMAKGEAGFYGNNVMTVKVKTTNPFDFSTLSKYKDADIGIMGDESFVFLKNVAEQFPELADKIMILKNGKYNPEDSSWELEEVPISVLPDLFKKYEDDIEFEYVDDRVYDRKYTNAHLKSKVKTVTYVNSEGKERSYEDSESLTTPGFLTEELGNKYNHSNDEMMAHFIIAAIEKYDGISINYHPEGYMTRHPEITEAIKAKGHDAIVQSMNGDEIVVFEPEQILIIDQPKESTTRFKAVSGNTNLIAIHNIKPGGIINANKIGGLPMPSLAILPAEHGFDSYGDISLIATKDFIDPKKNKQSKVFGSDVYSARYPSITYEIPINSKRAIDTKTSILPKDIQSNISLNIKNDIESGGIKRLKSSQHAKLFFLLDSGKDFSPIKNVSTLSEKTLSTFSKNGWDKLEYFELSDKPEVRKAISDLYWEQYPATDNRIQRMLSEDGYLNSNLLRNFMSDVKRELRDNDKINISSSADAASKFIEDNNLQKEYSDFINSFYNSLNVSEKIFKGFTPQGSRRYVPHTLANVLKEMKQAGIRGGESFNYGAGSVRASVTPEFKSLEQIKKNKNLIQKDIDAIKDQANTDLIDLLDNIKEFYKYDSSSFGYYDNASAELVKLSSRGYSESFKPLDPESRQAVNDYLDKLRNMPTDYFEAKINRGVSIGEFSYAIVPENTEQEVIDILNFNGVEIREYSTPEERTSIINEIAVEDEDIRFKSAYHGSPHVFTKFSTKHIGTGEGGQAYGWGLYFTDKKEIAIGYAETLAMDADVTIDGANAPSNITNWIQSYMLQYQGETPDLNDLKRVSERLLDRMEISQSEYDLIHNAESLNVIPRGNLYKVKIHGDKTIEDLNFLRWDKQVSDPIFDKIEAQGRKEKNIMLEMIAKDFNRRNITGQSLYNNISTVLNSDKEASLFLLKAGIDGIQYPTEFTSKGEHDESFNYVVFDENAVEIDEHIRFKAQTESPEFKAWFGNSKVVNEDGSPMIVYHGTNAKFNQFDNKLRGAFGIGYYFSSDKKESKGYGKILMPVFIKSENPASPSNVQEVMRSIVDYKYIDDNDLAKKTTEKLIEKGYDGILFEYPNKEKLIAVFSPTQIKSATGNIGTFDPENPDIRFKAGESKYFNIKGLKVRVSDHEPNRAMDKFRGGNDIELYTHDIEGKPLDLESQIDKLIESKFAKDNNLEKKDFNEILGINERRKQSILNEKIALVQSWFDNPDDNSQLIQDVIKNPSLFTPPLLSNADKKKWLTATDNIIIKYLNDLNKVNFKVAKSQQELDDFIKDSAVKETVYHGTNVAFDEFVKSISGGIFFTDIIDYTDFWSKSKVREQGGVARIIPVKLSLKNPKIKELKKFYGFHETNELEEEPSEAPFIERVWITNAINEGHDGLIIKAQRGNNYIVFSPDQILIEPEEDVRFKVQQAREEVNTNPTEAQKAAGNYQKGHLKVNGFDISIENPKGSMRSGVDKDGNEWSQEMKADYGYIKGTVGKDKDHIDVFLGDNLDSGKIYVIDQIDPGTKKFDEHKIMMGYDNMNQARKAYLGSYEEGWQGLRDITSVTANELKTWIEDGNTKKPFVESGIRFKIESSDEKTRKMMEDFYALRSAAETATKKKLKVRESAKESELTSDPDLIESMEYNQLSNKSTIESVRAYISDHGTDRSMLEYFDGTFANDGAFQNAIGIELYRLMNNDGNIVDAFKILDKLAVDGKKAGQEVQYLSVLKRMTPEGQLKYIKGQIDKINEDIRKHNRKSTSQKPLIEISEEEWAEIAKELNGVFEITDIQTLKDFIIRNSGVKGINKQRAIKLINGLDLELEWLRNRAVATILNKVYAKVPESIGMKISTFQAISHLLNPKTFLRNIISNRTMRSAERMSRRLGGAIDLMLHKIMTGEMVIGKATTSDQKKEIAAGAKTKGKETTLDILIEVNKQLSQMDKYRDIATQWSIPSLEEARGKTNTFQSQLFGALEKALTESLVVPDEISKQKVRAEYLAEYENRTGLKPDEEIMQEAEEMASYMTFQNDSWLSTHLTSLKKLLNGIGITNFGMGDLLIKYTRVPGNIITRTFEYSPLGAAKAIVGIGRIAMSKEKTREQQIKAIMGLSRGLTGTAIMTLGYLLAKAGMGAGDDDENDEIKKLSAEAGLSGDKLNVSAMIRLATGKDAELQGNDILMNYDWLQPIGSLLKAGSQIARSDNFGQSTLDIAVGFSELPSFMIINKMISEGMYSEADNIAEKAYDVITVPLVEGAGGFVPAPIRQIASITDKTARDTYYSGDDKLTQAGVKVIANIPGLRTYLPPRVRPTGEDKVFSTDNALLDILSTFGPGTLVKYEPFVDTKVLNAIAKFKSDEGTSYVPLRYAPKTLIVDGERYKLTKDEQGFYMRAYGQELLFDYIPEAQSIMLSDIDADSADEYAAELSKYNKAAKDAAKQAVIDNFNRFYDAE